MKTFKGLVIREKGRGESSKSITVLCADNGIIDIFVRGGMKSQKSSSATQVFSYSLFCTEEKKGCAWSCQLFFKQCRINKYFL